VTLSTASSGVNWNAKLVTTRKTINAEGNDEHTRIADIAQATKAES
jgi:hypothetical protein